MTNNPLYCSDAKAFRAWLAANGASCGEIVVGFVKIHTGRAGLTWPQAVDEALCFGWIDGVRQRVDDERYKIRFTPRKPSLRWSAVNIPACRLRGGQAFVAAPYPLHSSHTRATMKILEHSQLRSLYAQPQERARRKEIPSLDRHCRDFIALSPFAVLSTCDDKHNLDASPRGGDPGFVKVTDDGQLLLPDSPGNNRLDSLHNIIGTGKVGLLFFIPGFDETLRVNGNAVLSTDDDDIRACTTERRAPKLVVRVTVTAAYLHCAKAFLRSKLWSEASKVERTRLPTIGQMINDQTGLRVDPETREDMERRYAPDL